MTSQTCIIVDITLFGWVKVHSYAYMGVLGRVGNRARASAHPTWTPRVPNPNPQTTELNSGVRPTNLDY